MATAEVPTMPVQPETVRERDGTQQQAEQRGWRRMRLGRLASRMLLAGAILTGGVALAVGEAAPAEASSVSCYGDYCSGQYANQTGCDRDAQTLASADIMEVDYEMSVGVPSGVSAGPFESVKVGTVELRYSPTCKTKWARVRTTEPSGVDNVVVTQDTGYTQARHIGGFHVGHYGEGSPAAESFSPMIYSPAHDVHAYVTGLHLVQSSTEWK